MPHTIKKQMNICSIFSFQFYVDIIIHLQFKVFMVAFDLVKLNETSCLRLLNLEKYMHAHILILKLGLCQCTI